MSKIKKTNKLEEMRKEAKEAIEEHKKDLQISNHEFAVKLSDLMAIRKKCPKLIGKPFPIIFTFIEDMEILLRELKYTAEDLENITDSINSAKRKLEEIDEIEKMVKEET